MYVLAARAKLRSLERNTFLIVSQSVFVVAVVVVDVVVAVVRSVMHMCMCSLQEPSYTV